VLQIEGAELVWTKPLQYNSWPRQKGLENSVIKVKFPPLEHCKDNVSSVSPSSEQTLKGAMNKKSLRIVNFFFRFFGVQVRGDSILVGFSLLPSKDGRDVSEIARDVTNKVWNVLNISRWLFFSFLAGKWKSRIHWAGHWVCMWMSRLQISLCPLAQWMFCDVPAGKSTEIRKYPADHFRTVRVSLLLRFFSADLSVACLCASLHQI